jgi:hypothetical protein
VNATGGYCDVRGALMSFCVVYREISPLVPVFETAGSVAVAHGEAGRGSGALVGGMDRSEVMSNRIILIFL